MKKVTILILLVVIMCMLCACNTHNNALDKEICKLALQDLSYDSNYKTSLEFVKSESQSWLEYDVYTYILKVTKDDKTTNNFKYGMTLKELEHKMNMIDNQMTIFDLIDGGGM